MNEMQYDISYIAMLSIRKVANMPYFVFVYWCYQKINMEMCFIKHTHFCTQLFVIQSDQLHVSKTSHHLNV